jgi:glyoxylase-like metal-dependent hydrolase (beta-lactamase superfamily II)
MSFVATPFTRRKMVEKQVPYLKDLVQTDRGYVQYLEERVASGKRRDGSPMPGEVKAYLAGQARDLKLEMEELAGANVVLPNLTFDRELTIYLGAREVRVAFLGRGNTEGDAVVFVPDAKVVATGDLLVSPVPYGYGCHPSAWIETLAALSATDAKAIVPGHGPVMTDWSYAKKVSALLAEVRRQVQAEVKKGATLEETQQRVDVAVLRRGFAGDDFARGAAFDDFFLRSAVDRAYQEAKGAMAEE